MLNTLPAHPEGTIEPGHDKTLSASGAQLPPGDANTIDAVGAEEQEVIPEEEDANYVTGSNFG